jgi:prephenate dehydrogenase
MSFERVTVVGIGLIGGSIAAGARAREPAPLVRGVDTDADALGEALEHGVLDEAATPDVALERGWFRGGQRDLVVLATPVEAAIEWIGRLADSGYQGVVTDVASTKRAVVDAAADRLGSGVSFVGGHPMAGSERSGVAAARPDLFKGAYYVLTPSADSDMHAYRMLHTFVSGLGARVVSVDPATHDEAVAVVSHVPHMAASALTNLAARHAGERGVLLRLAAGGFKDMTRIAAGSPELWTGIAMDNREALLAGLDRLDTVLGEFRELLEAGDEDGMRAWLEEAAAVRRDLPAQWVPATTALTEVSIPVQDRPGVISEVATAVSSSGCNIEDIEIDHQSEDTAYLRLVLTDEGDCAGLIEALEDRGFEPESRALEDR